MDGMRLTTWQRRRLERQLHETTSARVFRRTQAILEVSRGKPIAQVARTVGVSRQTVCNWIHHYLAAHDPTTLADAPRSGRPSVWQDPLRSLLLDLLQTRPAELGYWASNWTVPLLQEHLEQKTGQRLSEDTVRRELARLGYAWKRSRYVLSPDPDQEKKTPYSPATQAFAVS
jgi:transposase